MAIRAEEMHEPDIIVEELMNGPYFGDERHVTCDSLPKPNVEAVGTTECVRGGLTQCDKTLIIKQIKASYDRVGLDTLEGEEPTKSVDYLTEVERQTEVGEVIVYDFKHSFVGWSPNLQLEHKDFLITKRSMAISAPASLESRMRLSAEIDRDYGHREFLFRQRPEVGKVVALTPAITSEEGKYVFLFITRAKEWDRVVLERLYECMQNLRDKLVEIGKTSVSMPIVDPGRGNIQLRDFYSMLATIFFGTDITIYLHDRYYLTIV